MVVYVNNDDCNDIISERKYKELLESAPDDFDAVLEEAGWQIVEVLEAFYKAKDKDYYKLGQDIIAAIKNNQEWIIERQYDRYEVKD